MKSARTVVLLLLLMAAPASALDHPWISTVFFYWYIWDSDEKLGSWVNGIHNTPLAGYYDSRTLADNRRSLQQASEWGVTHHFMDYWATTSGCPTTRTAKISPCGISPATSPNAATSING
jgi:hypothetical protein